MSSSILEFQPSTVLTSEEFRKFLQVVAELNAYASKILEWLNVNVYSVVGEGVQQAKAPIGKWPEVIRRAVVMGLHVVGPQNVEYSSNAYALFVKDFFGLYIEDYRVYANRLALGEDVSDLNIVFIGDTQFINFVKDAQRVTEFILKKSNEIGVNIAKPKTEAKSIEELVEGFIQKAYEVSVGVNNFATAVWGLRKILPAYMKKIYGEIQQQLLTALGFEKLLETKLAELWGFKDYFTQLSVYCKDERLYFVINNVIPPLYFPTLLDNLSAVKRMQIFEELKELQELSTLGGAICALNEIVWRYVHRLSSVGSKWFKGYTDLEKTYVDEVWKKLKEIGYEVPRYVKSENFCYDVKHHNIVYALDDTKDSYWNYYAVAGVIVDESGIIKQKIYCSRCNCGAQTVSESLLASRVFYDLIPAIFLGTIDITINTRLHGSNTNCDARSETCDLSKYYDVKAITLFYRHCLL
jgi:hypothetical protein